MELNRPKTTDSINLHQDNHFINQFLQFNINLNCGWYQIVSVLHTLQETSLLHLCICWHDVKCSTSFGGNFLRDTNLWVAILRAWAGRWPPLPELAQWTHICAHYQLHHNTQEPLCIARESLTHPRCVSCSAMTSLAAEYKHCVSTVSVFPSVRASNNRSFFKAPLICVCDSVCLYKHTVYVHGFQKKKISALSV